MYDVSVMIRTPVATFPLARQSFNQSQPDYLHRFSLTINQLYKLLRSTCTPPDYPVLTLPAPDLTALSNPPEIASVFCPRAQTLLSHIPVSVCPSLWLVHPPVPGPSVCLLLQGTSAQLTAHLVLDAATRTMTSSVIETWCVCGCLVSSPTLLRSPSPCSDVPCSRPMNFLFPAFGLNYPVVFVLPYSMQKNMKRHFNHLQWLCCTKIYPVI